MKFGCRQLFFFKENVYCNANKRGNYEKQPVTSPPFFPAEAASHLCSRRRKRSHHHRVMQGEPSLPDLFTFLVYQTKYRV